MTKRQYDQPEPLHETWNSFLLQQQQEGPADTQQQQQQQQQTPPKEEVVDDPFKDIPLDNLDEASRAAIEKARLGYTSTAKAQKELAEKVGKLERVAATYQSKADQATALLRKHNLDGTQQQVSQKSPEELQIEAIAAEYVKKGMRPDQALQYADLMSTALGVIRPGILNEVGSVLGPAITNLNTIKADRYISAYGQNPNAQMALQIPGVREGAQAIVDTMIANRQDITEAGVDAAIKMAMGEALMKNGGNLTNLQTQRVQPQVQQQQPSLLQTLFGGGGNGHGGFVPPTMQTAGNGIPQPANADTAKAAADIAALMDRQIKKK